VVAAAIANAEVLVGLEKALEQQLEEEAAAEEAAPPPHALLGPATSKFYDRHPVVGQTHDETETCRSDGAGRPGGPPPELDAPPGLDVNSRGGFESWSRPAATAAGWVFRGACWSTVELRYGPAVLLLVSLVGSKRLRGVMHDRAMRHCRGRAAAAARAAAAGEAARSQSQADLSLSASAGEGLRARQAANASRPSPHRSPSPFDWRVRLLGVGTATHAATPGDARRDLRRSPSRTPSVGAVGRVR
jgi:hypothetical protein